MSKLATELQEKINTEKKFDCKRSCTTLSIQLLKSRERTLKNSRQLVLDFNERIKITKAYYLYSGLSLIAEIGGYVGLFLGVSVIQITNLINYGINALTKNFN